MAGITGRFGTVENRLAFANVSLALHFRQDGFQPRLLLLKIGVQGVEECISLLFYGVGIVFESRL